MIVRDYMSSRVITLSPEDEVLKALVVLADNDIAGAPVLDQRGMMVGIRFAIIDFPEPGLPIISRL